MDSMSDIILAAFLREESFFSSYSSVVDDSMFDESSHKICINVYLRYIDQYSKRPFEEEMHAELSSYCRYYGMDDSIKQVAIETLIRCYKINYNIEFARDNFVRFAMRNKMTGTIVEAAKMIQGKGERISETDYEKIFSMVDDAISIKARDSEGVLLSDVADNPSEFISQNSRYDKSLVVKTGLKSFDSSHIAGGPIPGEMYVVAAPPGRGKSTFLVNVGAAALLQGKDVVHVFVGDNSEADGILRYCARLTGVTMAQIMLNSQDYMNAWAKLKDKFNLGDLMLVSYPIDGPTVGDIRSFLTRTMAKRGLDPRVLIVDYIDNCRRPNRDSQYEELGDLYTKFKNICEEMKIVGWTASQTKVDTWNSGENAHLGSLGESSKKQHVVDAMLTMRQVNDYQYQVYVPKMRRGRSDFTVDVIMDYERMFIKEHRVFNDIQGAPRSTDISVHPGMAPTDTSTAPAIPDSPYSIQQ